MKDIPSFCSWVVLLLSLSGAFGAEPQWQTATNGAAAQPQSGMTRITYRSENYSPVIVRLNEPMALPEDAERLRLWFAEIKGEFNIGFIIRDGKGKEVDIPAMTGRPGNSWVYEPATYAQWSDWKQADSVTLQWTGDPKERLQPDRIKRVMNIAPVRPFSLVGLRVTPQKSARSDRSAANLAAAQAGQGELWLGQLDWTTRDGRASDFNWYMPDRIRWGWDTPIRLFADDIIATTGAYRYEVEVRQGYQGQVIWRREGNADIDPANPPAQWKQAVELPRLPRGRYWIHTKAWSREGELKRSQWLDVYVLRSTENIEKKLSAFTPAIEWVTNQTSHVFPAETTEATLQIHVDSRRQEEWKTSLPTVEVKDWLLRPVPAELIQNADGLAIRVKNLRPGCDYRAELTLRAGSRVVDSSWLHFGVANKTPAPMTQIPTSVPNGRQLMDHNVIFTAEHWGSMFPQVGPLRPSMGWGQQITPAVAGEVDSWMQKVAGCGMQYVSLFFSRSEMEPLPGVYRWEELDRRIQIAQSLGLKVVMAIHYPSSYPYVTPVWSDTSPMLEFDGYPFQASLGKTLWPSWFEDRDAWLGWIKTVTTRYAGNPTIAAYHMEKMYYGQRVNDETGAYQQGDYSDAAAVAFGRWRADHGRKPVQPPKRLLLPGGQRPTFIGTDSSQVWRDWLDFRIESYAQYVKDCQAAIRSVDPVRNINFYVGPGPVEFTPAIKEIDSNATMMPEDGPGHHGNIIASMELQAGRIPAREAHGFVPPHSTYFDAMVFYSATMGDNVYQSIRWHNDAYNSFPFLADALRFYKDHHADYRRWFEQSRMIRPQVLVFGSRNAELTGYTSDGYIMKIDGIREFTALYNYHQLPAHFANEYSTWVDPASFNLVFAIGDVVTSDAAERLLAYARGGGKLVLIGDAAQQILDRGTLKNGPAQELAAMPNVRRIARPDQPAPPPGEAHWGGKAFREHELTELLDWANVTRTIRTSSPAFDVLRRNGVDHKNIHVGIFRRTDQHYPTNPKEELLRKWAIPLGTDVQLTDVPTGVWRVEQYHPEHKSLGQMTVQSDRKLQFAAPPCGQGELLLFELRRGSESN